ncbi:glycosyltransferase family 2 protein [bacterium]|nr:glycosyltransferase family 2 protein [bacterium]
MPAPLVSIVLPLYNGRLFVEETLRSVAEQSFKEAELIVVDDGSSDDGPAFVEEFCHSSADPVLNSLKLIREENAGVAAARNRGISESSGKYVALLDQDDIWEKERLSAMVEKLTAEGARWGYSAFYRFYADGRKVLKADGSGDRGETLKRIVEGRLFIPPSAALIEKSLLEEIKGFVPEFAPSDDWDLFLKLAEKEMGAYAADPLVRFRSHKTSTGKRQRDRIFLAQREVFKLHEETLKGLVPNSALRRRLGSIHLHLAQVACEKGMKEEAGEHFRSALKARPFRVKAWWKFLRFHLGMKI